MMQQKEKKRTYSGLFYLLCLFVMDEDSKGVFYCGKCRIRVGVLK